MIETFYNRLVSFYYQNQKIILSLFIFFSVVLLLGVPFSKWGFLHDDYGVIWHSKITSWKDLLRFFYNDNMYVVNLPSNYIVPEQSFFGVYYRPLAFVFFAVQMLFFKFSPYGYFLTTIFLHAISSVVLFHLFLYFFTSIFAFWGAMFFAFHPSLNGWLGWIAGQPYAMSLMLILLVFLLLKKYIDTKKIIFYNLSLLLFVVALLSRETVVILPLFLLLAYYFYQQQISFDNSQFRNIFNSFKFSLEFWLIAFFYLCYRMLLFPLKSSGTLHMQTNIFQILLDFKNRFLQFVTLLSDLAGLSFLPPDNRILKGSLIIGFFGILFYLFVKNRKKSLVVFSVLSMGIFLWPAILRYYASRYLYEPLPFFIFGLLLLIVFFKWQRERSKKIFVTTIYAVLVFNIVFLVGRFKSREQLLNRLNKSFATLALDKRINGKALAFIALPHHWFIFGVAQAMWMNGVDSSVPVYYDSQTFIGSHHPIFEKAVSVKAVFNGYRITSENPVKFLIEVWGSENLSMGKKVVNKQSNYGVSDITFRIDDKYLNQDIVFITWDYEKLTFLILDPPLR